MSGIPTQVYNGNTWYISAMLLAFVIIYPLIRKNKDFFIKFIAPVVIIFGLGCITHNFHTILVIEEWNGFLYYGLIRAVVDICIGCLVYELSTKIKKINLTTFGKIVITFLEIFLYLSVIIMLFSYGFRRYCYVLLFILMIPISITLADISLTKHVFSYKIFNWLGKYSYSLYLCHSIAYSHFIGQHFFNSKFSYFETMSIYFVVALISGLCIMYLSKLISYIWSKLGNKIKRLVIAEN